MVDFLVSEILNLDYTFVTMGEKSIGRSRDRRWYCVAARPICQHHVSTLPISIIPYIYQTSYWERHSRCLDL